MVMINRYIRIFFSLWHANEQSFLFCQITSDRDQLAKQNGLVNWPRHAN